MLPLQEVIIPAHDVNDAYFVSFPSKRLIFGGQGRAGHCVSLLAIMSGKEEGFLFKKLGGII
jgi:hypothetical protein